MSQGELVSAYLAGQMSRRTLIRRLIAGGVSAGAAVAYAQLLHPQTAGAQTIASTDDDLYPYIEISILSTTLSDVIANSRVRLHVVSSDEIATAQIRVLLKLNTGLLRIGRESFIPFITGGPGERKPNIDINPTPLVGRSKAKIVAQILASDEEPGGDVPQTVADAIATLT